jgi:hypothetical protein
MTLSNWVIFWRKDSASSLFKYGLPRLRVKEKEGNEGEGGRKEEERRKKEEERVRTEEEGGRRREKGAWLRRHTLRKGLERFFHLLQLLVVKAHTTVQFNRRRTGA